MLKLFKYLKPFALSIAVAIAFLFAQAFCDLELPNLMSNIVNIGIQQNRNDYIVSTGMVMLTLAILSGVCTVLVGLFSARAAAGFARDLRKGVFTKIERFSSAEFDKFSTASLITRCTNDVTQIQGMIQMGIRFVCYAPIMGVGGIIMAVTHSVSLSWIIALAVIILIGMVAVLMSIATPRFAVIQKLVDKLNLVSREGLSGMMVIRAFSTQDYEKKRFDGVNDELTRINRFVNRVMSTMWPVMNLINNCITVLIVWFGAKQIAASSMQVGDMMAYIQYAMQVIFSFLMISMMFTWIPRAVVSIKRIAEVLETDYSITDPAHPKPFDAARKGTLEFKNVSFRYSGAKEDALRGISFTVPSGKTTAIIGPTGSGKSTLINLALRFYDSSQGQVFVDGQDVRDVSQYDLRARIGYVPQKAVLLSGTIGSNLKYGKPDASEAEVETAASVAQALDFIREKSEKFDDPIAQGGSNVSGGQKQRLSIARALIKQPEIFIFDDSFSALDFKTDTMLRRALKEHARESTVIIVAQRVSTIMNADQIIVLEKGAVVGRGTHRELMKSCPEYAEIVSSQLSMEELS
jgi:ATP-binding cassette subfamily B protein